MTLNEVGFENVAIHSMMKQKERLAALSRFKSNIVKTLIATDIASRGFYVFFSHKVFYLKNFLYL